MTTPGLNYTQSADAPSAADTDNTQDIGSGGGALVKATNSGISPVGNIAMDPTQTAELLANMQDMVDQRTGAGSQFMRGLERASAWGSGGVQGPSQALATLNAQQQKEDESVFGMRQQMAAYKSAAAQQERLAKEIGNITGGGGKAGYQIPDEIQAAMRLAGNYEEQKKVFTDWAKENAKAYAQPDMDKPTIPVLKYDQANNSWVPDMVSPRAYRTGNYRDTAQTAPALQQNVPVSVRNNNPGNLVDPKTGEIRKFATPEEGDKAMEDDLKGKLSGASEAYKARFGNAPVTPATLAETWSPAAAKGNSPEATANYGKYIAKSLGIDTSQPIPNTPEALGKVKAAIRQFEAGAYTSPTQTGAIPPRPVSTQAAMQAQSNADKYREELAKGTALNTIADEKEFRKTINGASIADRLTSAERVKDLVKQYPSAVGILAKPGITEALFTLARDGITTPAGQIGAQKIEDALALTIPGTSQQVINARKEIAQNLARGALEASKLSQGQGSVSDFERSLFEKIAGSVSDNPQLLIKRQEMLIARAKLDKELGVMYRNAKPPAGQPMDYQKFIDSNEVVSRIEAYEQNLRSILGDSLSQLPNAPVTSGKTPGGVNFKIISGPKQ